MRRYFQLCSKVFGLVLLCTGVMAVLVLLPVTLFYAFYVPLVRSLSVFYVLQYLAVSIVPSALGLYLMRSENLFVRHCYPLPAETEELPTDRAGTALGPDPAYPPAANDGESPGEDRRYAPPGYAG